MIRKLIKILGFLVFLYNVNYIWAMDYKSVLGDPEPSLFEISICSTNTETGRCLYRVSPRNTDKVTIRLLVEYLSSNVRQLSSSDVRILSLSDCKKLDILPDLRVFTNIKELYCCRSGLKAYGIEGRVPVSLEVLNLSDCDLREGCPDLRDLINLKRLILCSTGVTAAGLEGKLPVNLVELDLFECNMRSGIPDLRAFGVLKNLNLRRTNVTAFGLVGKLPLSLESLNLCSCDLREGLCDLRYLESLKVLDITCSELSCMFLKKCKAVVIDERLVTDLVKAANPENEDMIFTRRLLDTLDSLGLLIHLS
jgi:Leucine-rich repeat (LRR) protein